MLELFTFNVSVVCLKFGSISVLTAPFVGAKETVGVPLDENVIVPNTLALAELVSMPEEDENQWPSPR